MIDQAAADLAASLARQKEDAVIRLVGLEFRQDIKVRIRKPRLMPTRLYRALMRTIVIEEGPVIFGRPRLQGWDIGKPRTDGYLFK